MEAAALMERALVDELAAARDLDLMRRISEADEEAFRTLFRRHAPTAAALAVRIVRQRFIAEEIVQEAFLAVWRAPAAFDPSRGSVRSWLLGLVHHRAVDAVRREEAQRRRAETAVAEAVIVDGDPAPLVVEEAALPQERDAVRAALGDLPHDQRRVIELMYFEGKTQTQISAELSLPLGTVKSRTLLGMRKLRAALVGMER
ncbi:MAG TPA: sigma-70 family RNA polymerase sigma factor [Actinomycetota bacterium]|nr:sigma-70 family RNA polymerase sigma factor [Actinomycetota bacterium]